MLSADEKKEAIRAFRPVFSNAQAYFAELCGTAYAAVLQDGAPASIFDAIDREPAASAYAAAGVVAGDQQWFQFGLISADGEGRSNECAYRIEFSFEDARLISVGLKLFVLNPKFLICDRGYWPAVLDATLQYEAADLRTGVHTQFSGAPAIPIGLLLESTAGPERLQADLPPLPPPGTDQWLPLESGGLLSRIDLSMSWRLKKGKLDPSGVAAAEIAGGAGASGLKLYAPDYGRFNGIVHSSGRFGIAFGAARANALLVLGDHSALGGERRRVANVLQEFGLQSGFRGVVFDNVTAHWLDDGALGVDIVTSVPTSAAVSFHEGGVPTPSQFYAKFSCKLKPTNNSSYLSLLKEGLSFDLALAAHRVRTCLLKGTFVVNDKADYHPYSWLADRDVVIALTTVSANDAGGTPIEVYGLDVSFDQSRSANGESKGTPIATITAADFPGISDKAFTGLAVTLTLTPIFVLGTNAPEPAENGAAKRVRFIEVNSGATLGATVVAAGLADSWFFQDAVSATEFRVTGARILSQPVVSAGAPGGPAFGRETALMFDIETELSIDIDGKLTSKRALAVRVENTGILKSGAGYKWVQALSGAFEVKVLDASIWNFGGLGDWVKLTGVTLRVADGASLEATMDIALNLGVVKAEKFKLSFGLDTPARSIKVIPGKISINVPGVMQGVGELHLGEGEEMFDAISGMIQVKLPSDLAISASVALLKTHIDGHDGNAFAIGGKVDFSKPFPLGTTAVGIAGVQALYASNLKRALKLPEAGGIPAELDWLSRAKGDVGIGTIKTIADAKEKLWEPAYDQYSIGLGAVLVILGAEDALNVNAMLVLDAPSSGINVYGKLNLFEPPKGNTSEPNKLTSGIMAFANVDPPNRKITMGALVELDDLEWVKIHGALSSRFVMGSLTAWAYNVGRHDRPVTAKVTLPFVPSPKYSAAGYFMVAGDRMEHVPRGAGKFIDLPGLAFALGFDIGSVIGGGGLYLSLDLQAFLDFSLGKTSVSISGGLVGRGELFIFIAGVGVNASVFLEAYQTPTRSYLNVTISACGSVRVLFTSIRACVRFSSGDVLPDAIDVARLISKVALISGTDVALFGQGAATTIDGVLKTILEGGDFANADGVPLDAVIGITLAAAPAHDPAAGGFLGQLGPSAQTTIHNFGKMKGGYTLEDVRLQKVVEGVATEITYDATSAAWWRNDQKTGLDQPLPIDLALLTRRPLALQNASLSDETVDRWVAAILGVSGVCKTPPPQPQLSFIPPSAGEDAAATLDPKATRVSWPMASDFRDADTDRLLAPHRPAATTVSVSERYAYGTAGDKFPTYPRFLARPVVEFDHDHGAAFAFLALWKTPTGRDGQPSTVSFECSGFGDVTPDQAGDAVVAILIAAPHAIDNEDNEHVGIAMYDADGVVIPSVSGFHGLLDPAEFAEGAQAWRGDVAGFAALHANRRYAGLRYYVVTAGPQAAVPGRTPHRVDLTFTRSFEPDWKPLLVGAVKFTSVQEIQRAVAQGAFNDVVISELTAYLKQPAVPILEPGSDYELAVTWSTSGRDIIPARSRDVFKFKTTSEPPPSLSPYLLATLPAPDEKLHPFAHKPGFSISSSDVLRILELHPGLSLKISIREDGGHGVVGTGSDKSAIDWTAGLICTPADLLNAADLPALDRTWFDGLPSRLMRALKDAITGGTLHCITDTLRQRQGLWVGLNATLKPLLGYTVRIDLVDETGEAWPGRANKPFHEWRFVTAAHSGLGDHAGTVGRGVPHQRRLLPGTDGGGTLLEALGARSHRVRVAQEYRDKTGVDPVTEAADEVSLVPDLVFEDLLAQWTGERRLLSAEAEVTVLWDVDDATFAAKAIAVLVRSREPLIRHTRTAVLVREEALAGSATILTTGEVITRYPALGFCTGVSALFASSGGTSLIAFVDWGSTQDVVVGATETPTYYLPYGETERADIVTLPRTRLRL
ncbi:hypothetical protein [Bosea beijingensis]